MKQPMTNTEALMALTRATAQIDVLSKMAKEAAEMMIAATSALYVNAAMNGEPIPLEMSPQKGNE